MNDINHRIDSLQDEISNIKRDIVILKGSSNLLFINSNVRRPKLREIAECVSEITGVPYAQIHSKRQTRKVVVPRQIISIIARREYYYTSVVIAKYFRREHATVLHSVKTMTNLIQTDKLMAELYKKCIKCVKEL